VEDIENWNAQSSAFKADDGTTQVASYANDMTRTGGCTLVTEEWVTNRSSWIVWRLANHGLSVYGLSMRDVGVPSKNS
jgi:hypothetical protein